MAQVASNDRLSGKAVGPPLRETVGYFSLGGSLSRVELPEMPEAPEDESGASVDGSQSPVDQGVIVTGDS